MATSTNGSQSSLNNFQQKMYTDFSGGFNDTSAAISIDDNQLVLSENVDYSVEVKALQTRKGCTKVNSTSFNADVTDGFCWMIGSTHKKCIVYGGKVYDIDTETGTATEKITLTAGATKIYPYIMYNVLYFGDGTELYTWGQFDYGSELGTQIVDTGTVVKCNDENLGLKGHFYQYIATVTETINNIPSAYASRELVYITDMSQENVQMWNFAKIYINTGETYGVYTADHWFYYDVSETSWMDGGVFESRTGVRIDLSAADYTDETHWADVTDVESYSSSVVKVLEPYDPSEQEVVNITVFSSATESGTVTLCLDDDKKVFTVTSGDSVSTIVNRLRNLSFDNWTSRITVTDKVVTFTCNEKKVCNAGYIDGGSTGIEFSYNTVTEGVSSNCDMTEIKKCTIFCVHQGSARVFAAGNPDDNAVYYSEIGYGNYFQGEVNKLYPAINGYGHVTGMCNLSSALVISYENGWYTWKGVTPLTDAYWEPLNIPYGCVNPRTLCLTPQSFTFLARDGIYNVSAAILNDQYILLQTKQVIKKLSEDTVEKTIGNINDVSLCSAVFYDNNYMLSYSTNGEYCDRVLKYEWDTGAFTVYTGWQVNAFMNDYDNLFFASDNYMLKAFDGYSDVNTNTGNTKGIEVHVKTKEYFFDTPQTNKVVQMISLIFRQYDKLDSEITVTVHAGYQKYEIGAQDLSESLYYSRLWGKRWGYWETVVKVIEIVMVSNVFQVELETNQLNDPITLFGLGFSYADTDLIIPTVLKDEELLV